VLCYLLKFPLPSFKQHISSIASGMFVLLRKYATAGAAKGDNLELVSMLFKVHESLFYLLALKLIVNIKV